MKITKIGHCCLIIELGNITILTDPGAYSSEQENATGIDLILITHEHSDHFHIESLKAVLKNNPDAEIITNKSVGRILEKEHIPYTTVGDNQSVTRKGVSIAGFGTKHWPMYKTMPPIENTAYFINNKLFYPGDSFCDPQKPIDILALPIVGPWTTVPDSIEYVLKLKPKKAFPVHDGILLPNLLELLYFLFKQELAKEKTEFIIMNPGDSKEF